jgi:hypothetical protein
MENSLAVPQHIKYIVTKWPGISVPWYILQKNESISLHKNLLVAHACNPSNSEGRDQEDHGLKSAQQIVQETVGQKNPSQKKRLMEWLKV